MTKDFVDKVEKVSGDAKKSDKVALPTASPNEEHFNALMEQQPELKKAVVVAGDQSTSINTLSANNTTTKPTTQSLLAQTEQAINKIDEVKETLETPNIGIKSPTHVKLLQNKLTHIDESLKIALSRAGVEFNAEAKTPTASTANRVNPIDRFLGFLSDGQYQLENLGSELQNMTMTKQELSPVNMLAIQVKVGQIQQELELFSTLLSQGLSGIKTIMNVQV